MASRPIAGVVVVASLVGCSTQYIPRAPGHLGVTMENGTLVYTRDGQRYRHGVFGGGLVDAVHGNDAATTAANEFHSRIRAGFVAGMIGFAAMIGGGTVALEGFGNDYRNSTVGASLIVALGGMVLAFAGAGYATSAEPYRLDAINIFNDSPPPSPPGPSAPAPTASLRMR